jgi:antitoxin component of MazEF toxin-antitoxin module
MPPVKLKVSRIGNSRGVRLPATTLQRYQIGDEVLMEERDDGILLRPQGGPARLSWADTAVAMASEAEDWSDWDSAASDGLETIPWDAKRHMRVAEPAATYKVSKSRKRSKK